MKIELPELLNIPKKLIPFLLNFKKYTYFLIEGGRGSAKTETAARVLLFLADKTKIKVLCGRETQSRIEESVHAVLKEIIIRFNLNFDVTKTSIKHRTNGSEFIFMGFREVGRANIKGTFGIDLLWIDEAEQITKPTLTTIIPTIRKDTAKAIFTMNRYTRDDAVPAEMIGRDDCLHIQINYLENEFCTEKLKKDAQICKDKDIEEYNHVWLGQPLAQADNYLINSDKLYSANDIPIMADCQYNQRVIGFDFAAQGGDFCVATILNRIAPMQWELIEQRAWKDPIATQSIGRIVEIMGEIRPNAACLDVGGMGYVVYSRLMELGITAISPFDGATTEHISTDKFGNKRAQAYHELRDIIHGDNLLIRDGHGKLNEQLSRIKYNVRSSGVRFIQRKEEMKKEMGHSPDEADSLMMAVWCANHHLDGGATMARGGIIRRNKKLVKR